MQPRGSVRLIPLGGLGEVGMNCLALEAEGDILIVDCGSTFPAGDIGVDVIVPDFSWLQNRADQVRGVFLTHGHEDHIGGLPYLLRTLRVPVWGPPHALRLVSSRLAEHGFSQDEVALHPAQPGSKYGVGCFEIEPIRVAHSIVEATALYIHVGGLHLVHSGDFKLDPEPSDGEPTDEARLAELGDGGLDLLLSDSTNVDHPGPPVSEAQVAQGLEELISAAPGRVIVGLFASNVQRLISLGDIAAQTGRKICLMGRSLHKNVAAASEVGRLRWPSNLCIAPEQLPSTPPRSVLVLAGGTQGEAQSTLTRISKGEHAQLELGPEDTVILSSRIIPGREHAVFAAMAGFYRRGATVHTRATDPHVHASGHATRSEQERLIELLRPRCFMPLHGTVHHMVRHAQLAKDVGVDEVLWVENGAVVELDDRRLRRVGWADAGRTHVAFGGLELGQAALAERAELGRSGMCVVAGLVDERGLVPDSVRVHFVGVGVPLQAGTRVTSAIQRSCGHGSKRVSSSALVGEVTRIVQRTLYKEWRVRPVVEVQLLDAD